MRFRLDVSTGPDATRSSAQMSTFRSQTALVRCGRIRSNHVRSRGSQERTGSGEPIADSGRGWRATRPQHRSARPAPVHGKGAVLHQANSEGCALPAIRSGRVDRREGTNHYPLMTDSDQRPATARSCSPGPVLPAWPANPRLVGSRITLAFAGVCPTGCPDCNSGDDPATVRRRRL